MKTEEDLIALLADKCADMSQAKTADALGISPSTLSLTLTGKRALSENTARLLGFVKRTVYVPVGEATCL